MICLVSPAYLHSQYCLKQLELFYNKAQEESTGLEFGGSSRILNVLLYNILDKLLPYQIKDVTIDGFYNNYGVDELGGLCRICQKNGSL